MGKKKYLAEVSNFRELVKKYEEYAENIAFKFKNAGKIEEITYKQFIEDIKKVAEKVISSDVKRVAVIGNNRYEWCTTYLGVTTAGRVIVPLDKALTDKEIEKLLKRSEADAIVYDEKYQTAVDEAVAQGCNIKYKICMDKTNTPGVINYEDILKDGEKIISSGKARYDDVKLKENEMYIFDKYYWATENKEEVCKKENIDIMIDDFCKNCESIANSKIKTIYLKDAPSYDLEENKYIKVLYNWGEIYRYINEIENK